MTTASTALSSSDRLEACLARIAADPQGSIIFTKLYTERARADAAAADARLAAGRPLSALDGAIVALKDLHDVKGEPTVAGSALLVDAAPATKDAEVVRRLRRAGAVIIGKTHMTEFAFSAVGANPHFGTPGNCADVNRIASGSSTGAAIALGKGMCEYAVGSDTGGSIRMPSALCGGVGLKPTQKRIPRDGLQTLSMSLDTCGAMARSVEATALLDAILSGEEDRVVAPAKLKGARIAVPTIYFQDEMDEHVRANFEAAIAKLEAAGVEVVDIDLAPELEHMKKVNERATFPNVESSFVFREFMAKAPEKIDPFIRSRIERGQAIEASHYIWMIEQRGELIKAMNRHFEAVDFILTPTVPIVAPLISEIETPEGLARVNLLLLRNAWVSNFFDIPALSLPCQTSGLPVGLQIAAAHGADGAVLNFALAVEQLLAA